MKNSLLIRIPPPLSTFSPDTIVQWGVFSMAGKLVGEVHLTAINQLKAAWLSHFPHLSQNDNEPDEIVLLLGGTLCFYKQLTINSGQKKHLVTAVPYLVEEHLAQDIETMHIVHGQPTKDLQISVAAISHATLQSLLALFDDIQLSPNRVLTEAQFIFPKTNCTSLLLDKNAFMLKTPGSEGIALGYHALSLLFQKDSPGTQPNITATGDAPVAKLLPTEGTSPTEDFPSSPIKLFYPDTDLPTPQARVEEVGHLLQQHGYLVENHPLAESTFAHFAEYYFDLRKKNQLIEFRQGVYQCRRRSSRFIRRWWPVGAVATLWLLLELGFAVAKGLVYQHQAKSLWNESVNSYLAVFPNDRQAQQAKARQQTSFNIKQIMTNRLKSLDSKPTVTAFLPMLKTLSDVTSSLENKADVEPKALDFNHASGLLVYELSANSLEAVNQFLNQLNTSGLSAKLDNASQGKTGVIAKVTIRQ